MLVRPYCWRYICTEFCVVCMVYVWVYSQSRGYSGRTNKPPDSCYSFWYGATLAMIDGFRYTDLGSTREYLLQSCQYAINFSVTVPPTDEDTIPLCTTSPTASATISHCTRCGFCKLPNYPPDVLHTFYSLGWLSLAHHSSECVDGAKTDESSKLNKINPITGLRCNKHLVVI